jgi:hypothetical protein
MNEGFIRLPSDAEVEAFWADGTARLHCERRSDRS